MKFLSLCLFEYVLCIVKCKMIKEKTLKIILIEILGYMRTSKEPLLKVWCETIIWWE